MSFKLKQISRQDWIAEERLYLASDQKTVVKEGDERAAVLLAAKGQIVPEKTVKRLGLDAPQKDETAAIKERSTRTEKPSATR